MGTKKGGARKGKVAGSRLAYDDVARKKFNSGISEYIKRKMKKPTIVEIKNRTKKDSPYYFEKSNMRSFGQTMKSFNVYKSKSGRIYIYAKSYDRDGTFMGFTCTEYVQNEKSIMSSKLKSLDPKLKMWQVVKVDVLKNKLK